MTEQLHILQSNKVSPEEARLEAQDIIVLGILLDNALANAGFYLRMQDERSRKVNERPGVDLSSLTSWLKTRRWWSSYWGINGLEVGEIASTAYLIIYQRQVLNLPPMHHEARDVVGTVWIPRLPEIVRQFNAHPLTDDLPEVKLVVSKNSNFTVSFVVD